MTFKIENDVPLSRRVRGGQGGRKPKYPFGEMKIGQSFAVTKRFKQVIASAHSYGHLRNKTFVGRSDGKDSGRIWRIK